MKSQAVEKALDLQAKIYDLRAADHEQRIAKNTADIARALWIAAGVSMALSALVTLTMLSIALLSLWLAFRK